MAKREVHYPHKIGFRLTDETWFRIQREIAETDLTPHDWCRLVVLDKLKGEFAFSRKERYFLHQILRIQYMVGMGFNLVAHNELSVERWRRFRNYAHEHVERLVKMSSAEFESLMESEVHKKPINAANQTPGEPMFGED